MRWDIMLHLGFGLYLGSLVCVIMVILYLLNGTRCEVIEALQEMAYTDWFLLHSFIMGRKR